MKNELTIGKLYEKMLNETLNLLEELKTGILEKIGNDNNTDEECIREFAGEKVK